MSWSDYTNFLRAKNICENAAILSAEDGTLVAGDGFNVRSRRQNNNIHRSLLTMLKSELTTTRAPKPSKLPKAPTSLKVIFFLSSNVQSFQQGRLQQQGWFQTQPN
jgi:hypothetical protein